MSHEDPCTTREGASHLPFKSQAQRGYLFAHDPKVAKEFAADTPKGEKLPRRVRPKLRPKRGQKKPQPSEPIYSDK